MTTTRRFTLHLSAEKYLAHYRGAVKAVVVRCNDGQTLQFPSDLLQRFVDHDGVHGEFEIQFDDQNKFLSLRRVIPT
jgi:hypothetical protein